MIVTSDTPPSHPVDSFGIQVGGDLEQAVVDSYGDYTYNRTEDGEDVGRRYTRDGTTWVSVRTVDGAPDGYSTVSVAEHPWQAFPLGSYSNFKFTNNVDRTVNSSRLGVASARLGEGITNTMKVSRTFKENAQSMNVVVEGTDSNGASIAGLSGVYTRTGAAEWEQTGGNGKLRSQGDWGYDRNLNYIFTSDARYIAGDISLKGAQWSLQDTSDDDPYTDFGVTYPADTTEFKPWYGTKEQWTHSGGNQVRISPIPEEVSLNR